MRIGQRFLTTFDRRWGRPAVVELTTIVGEVTEVTDHYVGYKVVNIVEVVNRNPRYQAIGTGGYSRATFEQAVANSEVKLLN